MYDVIVHYAEYASQDQKLLSPAPGPQACKSPATLARSGLHGAVGPC